jgi:hypothetical protein
MWSPKKVVYLEIKYAEYMPKIFRGKVNEFIKEEDPEVFKIYTVL